MRIIEFHCRKCKCSMHMSYGITGDENKNVMDGIILKCKKCKKVSMMKKYTEGKIAAGADKNDKYYL